MKPKGQRGTESPSLALRIGTIALSRMASYGLTFFDRANDA